MRSFLAVSFFGVAAGHGWMNEPPPRAGATMEGGGSCPYGTCLWFNQGCTIGCPECGGPHKNPTCGAQQGKATLPTEARTYFDTKECGTNPWCAPGSAPIINPCGIAGGFDMKGVPGAGGEPPFGYAQGFPGDKMPENPHGKRTWKAGGTAEVAWSIVANHGGGYQYRLCPKNANTTEECFQKMPLEFASDTQEIQFCPYPFSHPLPLNATPNTTPADDFFRKCDPRDRVPVNATKVSEGTLPKGSTWMRNPIPACKATAGGAFDIKCGWGGGKHPSDFQFPPATLDLMRPGFLLGGFGGGACGGCTEPGNSPAFCGKLGPWGPKNCTIAETLEQFFQFSIVDSVKVPKVPAGDYVVSFRWDTEQTPQIWSQCADVTITDNEEIVV